MPVMKEITIYTRQVLFFTSKHFNHIDTNPAPVALDETVEKLHCACYPVV